MCSGSRAAVPVEGRTSQARRIGGLLQRLIPKLSSLVPSRGLSCYLARPWLPPDRTRIESSYMWAVQKAMFDGECGQSLRLNSCSTEERGSLKPEPLAVRHAARSHFDGSVDDHQQSPGVPAEGGRH